jgi:hypothetical protein
MSIDTEEITPVGAEFYDDMKWDLVARNKIERDQFLAIRSKTEKCYATFLGSQDNLAFYMFKALGWYEFKEIRQKEMDKDTTHEYIIENCLLWPRLGQDKMTSVEAGVALTLVYQILSMSNFLKDPSSALKMIVEI